MAQLCRICGDVTDLVEVHGHSQCSRCGVLAEECCQGAAAPCSTPIIIAPPTKGVSQDDNGNDTDK